MTTMVERVARALYDAMEPNEHYGGHVGPFGGVDGNTCLDGEFDLAAIARAAIEAFREPTDEMVEAGWRAKGDSIDGRPVWKLTVDVEARHCFQAMISAALGETDLGSADEVTG